MVACVVHIENNMFDSYLLFSKNIESKCLEFLKKKQLGGRIVYGSDLLGLILVLDFPHIRKLRFRVNIA